MPKKKYIVGIDEVGRGPLAGPVAVCAFRMDADFDASVFGPVRDSKKLSPEQRKRILAELKKLKNVGAIDYAVSMESAKRIDEIGIAACVDGCIADCLGKLGAIPGECRILLDGGIAAPGRFRHQHTIVGGDAKERAIAFASIVAKVARDALMVRAGKRYPGYGFEIHKGYGTAAHRKAMQKIGLTPLHRRSFCNDRYS